MSGIIALTGNPNAGKTTIFNSLTGARQHVGNWPGVTVEKKEGLLKFAKDVSVIDLPGTYSLSAYSEDELIARNYLIQENPDVVIDVIDATNLKRNMYLAVQLLELNKNVVLALNMLDEAKNKKIEINIEKMAKILNVPVVATVATRDKGIKELVREAKNLIGKKRKLFKLDYGKELEKEIVLLEEELKKEDVFAKKYDCRWAAIKILEGDEHFLNELKNYSLYDKVLSLRNKAAENIIDLESAIIERRYEFIEEIASQVVKKTAQENNQLSTSDKIDKIVLNKYLGLPIFALAMYITFQLTFTFGEIFIGYIEDLFEYLGESAATYLGDGLLSSFVADGLINGIGSIMVFLPPIILLFFFISFLEDSGYMARAAYVMDKFMRLFGLQGKAFIPMLMGFGCTVPAVMATRTLEDKNDRMVTILITPLMSCGAKIPIYALFVSAFFTQHQGLVLFSIYALGIVLAVLMGKLFKKYLFPSELTPFVMELPPYRIPTLKGTLIHMWEKASAFIKKAGTIIFGTVVLIWALASFPAGVEFASQESLIGKIGSVMAPLFAPLGLDSWETSAALIFGLLAKEVVVATLGIIYGTGEGLALTETVRTMWTPLTAYAFMVLSLIYVPCAAALGAIKRETNSWKWTGFAALYTLTLGWIIAFIIYHGGILLGFK